MARTRARELFRIGDRVQHSERAVAGNLCHRGVKHGRVFGYSGSPLGIRVLWDGLKGPQMYHIDYIAREESSDAP
jgi:hypothetical protein